MKRIAVKVGSNVLTRRDGTLDITRMSAIVDQVAELHKRGIQVILVSSGAVASGRSEIHPSHTLDEVSSRQLYSAIGQAKLMGKYYTLFREHGIICGQVLTTKEGLDKIDHYENQRHCMEVMLTEDGQFRLKGYTHTVDKYSLREASTIQGVGFVWKKDFNWPSKKRKGKGVESGKSRVKSQERKVESQELKVESEELKVESQELKVENKE